MFKKIWQGMLLGTGIYIAVNIINILTQVVMFIVYLLLVLFTSGVST